MEHVTTVQLDIQGSPETLDSLSDCKQLLDDLVHCTGLTKLHSAEHQFQPQGVSIVYLLAESHLAIHTWPEHSSAYITLSTCSNHRQGTAARISA